MWNSRLRNRKVVHVSPREGCKWLVGPFHRPYPEEGFFVWQQCPPWCGPRWCSPQQGKNILLLKFCQVSKIENADQINPILRRVLTSLWYISVNWKIQYTLLKYYYDYFFLLCAQSPCCLHWPVTRYETLGRNYFWIWKSQFEGIKQEKGSSKIDN